MAKAMGKVILGNVRLSFDHIFEAVEEEKDDGTTVMAWKANFLFPKTLAERTAEGVYGMIDGKRMDLIAALKLAGEEAMVKKYTEDKAKHPKIAQDRRYLRDGDDKEYDGYPGNYYFAAKASLKDRPSVLTNRRDGNGQWIPAEPGGNLAPYAGCYVNAICSVWIMDHKKYGKRMCMSLHSVQFYRDGEAFRAQVARPDDDFTDDMAGAEGSIGGDFGDDDADDMV